jgi:hypothetical protein
MYPVSSHLIATPADLHRLLFQKLVNSNNKLSTTVTTYTKRPWPNDLDLDALTGNTQASHEMLPPLSQFDFPLVKFWTREDWNVWNSARKDSSSADVDNTRGRPTDYIKEVDRMPVSAKTITRIRLFARSICIGAFECGKAPKTWGGASKELRDEYLHEMESHWGILWYC